MEPALTSARRARLLVEAALLYGLTPVLFWYGIISIRALHPLLLAGGLASLLLMASAPDYPTRLWNFSGFKLRRRVVLKFFGLCVPIIFAFMVALLLARSEGWIDVPKEVDWFALPRHRPEVYVLVMIGYPLLSVYPQELIYRGLFFHRYAPAFGSTKTAIVVNALLFGWAHIIFHNWVAVGLTIAGGALFSGTYIRTKSLLAASVEHSLYGGLLFTIGLGWYFFGSSVRALEKAAHMVH